MWKLSTSVSIARWEKEVNELAGFTVHDGIRSEDNETVEIPPGCVEVKFIAANGFHITSSDISENKIRFPQNTDIRHIIFMGSGGNTIAESDLSQGEGDALIIFVDTGEIHLKLSGDVWIKIEVSRTWQEKIELAHQYVEFAILRVIRDRGHRTTTDAEALALVRNPKTFQIASDMKALELIYADLAHGAMNINYQQKADMYAMRYENEITAALARMSLTITSEPAVILGRINR